MEKAFYNSKQTTASSIHSKQFFLQIKENFKRSSFFLLFCQNLLLEKQLFFAVNLKTAVNVTAIQN